ncbi:hypothetical protein IWX90DRAFT_411730 [Phyllosticta citrichinensis]|uniref:Uncharacterized protein n=1 Tax=Phyllosticta citrichinensis TaxID=1130410 RepID=A0ABR1Y1X5_9PEZI
MANGVLRHALVALRIDQQTRARPAVEGTLKPWNAAQSAAGEGGEMESGTFPRHSIGAFGRGQWSPQLDPPAGTWTSTTTAPERHQNFAHVPAFLRAQRCLQRVAPDTAGAGQDPGAHHIGHRAMAGTQASSSQAYLAPQPAVRPTTWAHLLAVRDGGRGIKVGGAAVPCSAEDNSRGRESPRQAGRLNVVWWCGRPAFALSMPSCRHQ